MIEHINPETVRLRDLAAMCYAMLGAECGLPKQWLDTLSAAAVGEPFDPQALRPLHTYTALEVDPCEALRPEFERLASSPTWGFKRSQKGTYVNPALARDWKWFKLGIAAAQEKEQSCQPSI